MRPPAPPPWLSPPFPPAAEMEVEALGLVATRLPASIQMLPPAPWAYQQPLENSLRCFEIRPRQQLAQSLDAGATYATDHR